VVSSARRNGNRCCLVIRSTTGELLIQIKTRRPIRLPGRRALANMATMFSRRTKSLVACCAVLAVLLCHAFGVVYGHQLDRRAVENALGACHTIPADEQGDSGKSVHGACDSGLTAAEAVKLPAVTLTLLSLVVAFIEHPAQLDRPGWAMPIAFAGASPPIHLLHCCLRN
jgi:hypothetical protein